MSQAKYFTPTAEQYETVQRVYKETGIMSVKDAATANFLKPETRCGGIAWEKPWQGRPDYGEDYRPNVVGTSAAEVGFSTLTRHRRAIRIEHVGTPHLPQGLAVGGVEIWVTDDVFGMQPPRCVKWQSDMGPDEELRLERWARDIHHVTDEEYNRKEQEGRERQANRAATQVDPAGALVKALAPALKELAAGQAQRSAPSPEQLEAAGFYKDETGEWRRRPGRPKLEPEPAK